MKFIGNGPDIPEKLIVEHLNGNVVFVCGAGISCNAGMPLFKTLYDNTVEKIGLTSKEKSIVEKETLDQKCQYLESNFGNKLYVRKIVENFFRLEQEKIRETPKKLITHKSILTLSKNKKGLHIVTTNYENLFEQADKEGHNIYSNTRLPEDPIKWDGIVHIHGTLNDISNIVLTSNDFGREYVNKGCVASFLKKLLSHYYVCFLGYSLDDAMMRYFLGGLEPKYKDRIYAFLEDGRYNENVNVISYNPVGHHSLLHKTLKEWARFYIDVQSEPCRIIKNNKNKNPIQKNTKTDKVLAILKCDDLRFLNEFCGGPSTPSYEWVDAVVSLKKTYKKKAGGDGYLNNKYNHIINTWLAGFFLDFRLIFYLTEMRSLEDKDFNSKIKKKISEYKLLYKPVKGSEQNSLCELWKLYTQRKLTFGQQELKWPKQANGLINLAELIRLNFSISDPMRPIPRGKATWNGYGFNLDIEFKYGDAYERLRGSKDILLKDSERNIKILETELKNALHVLKNIYPTEKYNSMMKENFSFLPHDHRKNWVVIINLICDCWLNISKSNPRCAQKIFKAWIESSDTVFQRIAFILATRDKQNIIPVNLWFNCLIQNKGKVLLDENIEYEIDNLLKEKTAMLDSKALGTIINLLMAHRYDKCCVDSRIDSIKLSGCKIDSDVLQDLNPKNNSVSISNQKCSCYCGNDAFSRKLPTSFKALFDAFVSDVNNNYKWRSFFANNPSQTVDLFKKASSKGIFDKKKFKMAIDELSFNDTGDNVYKLIKATIDFIPSKLLIPSFDRLVGVAGGKVGDLSFDYVKILSKLFNKIASKRHLPKFKCDYDKRTLGNIASDPFGLYVFVLSNYCICSRPLKRIESTLIFHDLSLLCNQSVKNYYYGRLAIAEKINVFYNLNKRWISNHFKPLLSWDNLNCETALIWAAFYKEYKHIPELLDEIRESINHYEILYYPENLCFLLFHLYVLKKIKNKDLAVIFDFPEIRKDFLESFSIGIYNWIKRSYKGYTNEYNCKKYVVPFIIKFWPKSNKHLTDETILHLYLSIINSGKFFRKAFLSLEWALRKIEIPYRIIKEMSDSDCCFNFPEESLRLLNGVINDDTAYSVDSIDFDGIEEYVSSYKNIKDLVEKYRSRIKNN